MFKNIFKVSVVTAVVLFSGCGGSDGKSSVIKDPNPKALPKVSSELPELLKAQRSSKSISYDELNSKQPQNQDGYSCSNGGEIKFSTQMDQEAMMQQQDRDDFNVTQITEVINCIEDGITANGKIETKVIMDGNNTTTIITYLTDMNMTSSGSINIVKKGSKTITGMENGKKYQIEDSETIIDGKVYKDIDLKSYIIDLNDDKTAIYEVSGKEQFDNKILTVDESYDSSKTPMIFNSDGDLLRGGAQRYRDEQNSTVWIKAIEKNRIEISVDKDNDGKTDELEVIKL